ncbi:hypothetical protein [Hymenobacter sp. GOD-10R]|uniref:hypothetical protein n=1 Tax=Hymenobacter sp. GOD-10R TaxID=3093922 RepID=UPI002D76F2E7|nr:hypothetical protein [Hymenobacter sp. GOD-10R]WRQ29529.1 hypothetical protein SD425_04550 [Hymenobacter sp. GOD-10R]
MLKLLSATSLFLLIGASSYAQKAFTSQYVMLVRELDNEAISGPKPSLTLIEPNGSFTTIELPKLVVSSISKKDLSATLAQGRADSTSTLVRRTRYLRNYIYQAEVKKLNELGTQGWVLVNTLQEGSIVRYLLRKETPSQQ